ncbi:unnamed protein product [Lymnaea stagnalis]|uniref:3'-5' exonuclease n=1 Tax=Lymnaea stagnalis TaxID=6523 RepID=A0AAV2HIN1_LYMST
MSFNEKKAKRPLPKWMETLNQQKQMFISECQESAGNINAFTGENDASDSPDGIMDGKTISTNNQQLSYCKNPLLLNTASQILSQSMPLLSFKGSITYSYHYSDCACICQDILSSLHHEDKNIIGFDMEWPASYQKGFTDKTALIQLCVSEDSCFLFHVAAMCSVPKPLIDLILNPCVILVGLNITSDLWKLERDFDVRVKPAIDRGSVCELGIMANKKLKSSERWDLDGLCRNVLRHRLDKDRNLRCGNWADVPLNDMQKNYAASDALASLLLYKHLNDKLNDQVIQ